MSHVFGFTLGEACLVTSGLVLYFGDMLAYTIEKVIAFLLYLVIFFSVQTAYILIILVMTFLAQVSGFFMKSEVVQYGSKRSEISIIIQVCFLRR